MSRPPTLNTGPSSALRIVQQKGEDLCLMEKTHIFLAEPRTLKERNGIVAKCHQQDKVLLLTACLV